MSAPPWQAPFTGVVLILMFAVLLTDRVGTDAVMASVATIFVATNIITLEEGVAGFSNLGLISVMILFMVAEGMARTGALDWYMAKILGRSKSVASAQIRLMLPLTVFSAFLNNTPIVVVMTPIILGWAKNNKISPKQLLIPLSYGAIFGGTCTLMGTSTNLVVAGLLSSRYPGTSIGFFDLALIGVPVACIGISYILLASPYLLPDGGDAIVNDEDVLLKARLTPFSSAANRTLHRSGLRDTGGIYLVSVRRAATGNLHHAVGREFVLNAGDILYFTGLVEEFNEFCEEHGLEMVTDADQHVPPDSEVGTSEEALLSTDPTERSRLIYQMTDLIHGNSPANSPAISLGTNDPSTIVDVEEDGVISIGVNSPDRNNLLLDISRGLSRLDLEIRNSEAAVVGRRSISVWKCAPHQKDNNHESIDIGQIWCVLEAIPGNVDWAPGGNTNGTAKSAQVVRSKVTISSRLIGKTIGEVSFSDDYKASVLALMRDGKNYTKPISAARLQADDILVLRAINTSPLLVASPSDFYKDLYAEFKKQVRAQSRRDESQYDEQTLVWRDLQVDQTKRHDVKDLIGREFVVACRILPGSSHEKLSIAAAGLDQLPGVHLLSIERGEETLPFENDLNRGDVLWFAGSATSIGDLRKVPGLELVENDEVKKLEDKLHSRRLMQAVVSRSGTLVGKTIRELKFRTHYGAAVIAVHREGKRIPEHPGNIKLLAGDVLLLEAGPMFLEQKIDSGFTLLSSVEDSTPPRLHLFFPALVVTVGMIALFTSEVLHLVVAAMIASILMVLMGVMSEDEARKSLNWNIYVTIACAFGVGKAMVASGLAESIASALVNLGESLGIGDAGVIGAVYLSTFFISNLVTNNAAAALLFPVALDAAEKTGIDTVSMSYAVLFGASACFASPFGYQTHLIVFQPGGYSTTDFVKFGTPLQIVLLVMTVFFLSNDKWLVNFVVSVAILVAAVAFRVMTLKQPVREVD